MESVGLAPEARREIKWYIEAVVAETRNRIIESFNLEKSFEVIGSNQACIFRILNWTQVKYEVCTITVWYSVCLQ